MAAWFNRGRALVLAASVLAAYAALQVAPSRGLYTAAAVLVPFNALAALAFPERGARFGQGLRWLVFLFLQASLLFILLRYWRVEALLESPLLRSPPAPLAARLMFAAAAAVGVARAWPTFSPLEVGLPAALAAFLIACQFADSPGTWALFIAAVGVLLLVAVLHESHRMAFRDALTGLPNRRALEEQLRALGDAYAIAMVDVDHFKAFNDTHGHDIGDQVLKLVAARLAEVEGGGRAFRYGGEEFTVLFPGRYLPDCMPSLERLRASIESYPMALRGEDRPQDIKEGAKRRASVRGPRAVSVTVSIGAASPAKSAAAPAEVLKLADEALYRAKKAGRNRVSR